MNINADNLRRAFPRLPLAVTLILFCGASRAGDFSAPRGEGRSGPAAAVLPPSLPRPLAVGGQFQSADISVETSVSAVAKPSGEVSVTAPLQTSPDAGLSATLPNASPAAGTPILAEPGASAPVPASQPLTASQPRKDADVR